MKERSNRGVFSGVTTLLLLVVLAGAAYGATAVLTRPQPLPPILLPPDDAGEPPAADAPTPTPPAVGFSRSNPHPRSATLTLNQWRVQVLDEPIIRGDRAWAILQAANSFNDPPADGWEYLLVKIALENTHPDQEEERTLLLHVTGSSNVIHYGFDAGGVSPEPALKTYLPGGTKSEGWETFRVREGEEDLLLIVEDSTDYEAPIQFIALEPGTAIEASAKTLESIAPTYVGVDPAEPASVGQIATGEAWQISLVEVIRGEPAWAALLETNRFNDPPPEGYEYLLLKARIRYIGAEEGPVYISRNNFTLQDPDGREYDKPSEVVPDPELRFEFFPGGEAAGWMVLQVAASDADPLLIFNPDPYRNTVGNIRFLSLRQHGR